MLYVFVDTNIWFRVVTQGKPGCEMEHFRELKELATKGKIELLHPEVVALEFEKLWTHFESELTANTDKMERAFKELLGKGTWSEVEDIHTVLPSFLTDYRGKKSKDATERHKEVSEFLASPSANTLDLHLDMWLRAKKRLMAGRVPPKRPDEKTEKRERERDNDLCIIETLYVFFDKLGGKKDVAQLLFCSANTRDFVLENDGKIIGLHPCHAKGLPPSQYFTDLEGLLAFIKKHRKIKEPDPNEVKQALEKEKTTAQNRSFVVRDQFSGLFSAFRTVQPPLALPPDFHDLISAMTRANVQLALDAVPKDIAKMVSMAAEANQMAMDAIPKDLANMMSMAARINQMAMDAIPPDVGNMISMAANASRLAFDALPESLRAELAANAEAEEAKPKEGAEEGEDKPEEQKE